MSIPTIGLGHSASQLDLLSAGQKAPNLSGNQADPKLEKTFQEFVGTVFYGQFMKAMRGTLSKPAYFHGGRAEEIFQGQLDQTLIEQLSKQQAGSFGAALFKRFGQGLSATDVANQSESTKTNGPEFLERR